MEKRTQVIEEKIEIPEWVSLDLKYAAKIEEIKKDPSPTNRKARLEKLIQLATEKKGLVEKERQMILESIEKAGGDIENPDNLAFLEAVSGKAGGYLQELKDKEREKENERKRQEELKEKIAEEGPRGKILAGTKIEDPEEKKLLEKWSKTPTEFVKDMEEHLVVSGVEIKNPELKKDFLKRANNCIYGNNYGTVKYFLENAYKSFLNESKKKEPDKEYDSWKETYDGTKDFNDYFYNPIKIWQKEKESWVKAENPYIEGTKEWEEKEVKRKEGIKTAEKVIELLEKEGLKLKPKKEIEHFKNGDEVYQIVHPGEIFHFVVENNKLKGIVSNQSNETVYYKRGKVTYVDTPPNEEYHKLVFQDDLFKGEVKYEWNGRDSCLFKYATKNPPAGARIIHKIPHLPFTLPEEKKDITKTEDKKEVENKIDSSNEEVRTEKIENPVNIEKPEFVTNAEKLEDLTKYNIPVSQKYLQKMTIDTDKGPVRIEINNYTPKDAISQVVYDGNDIFNVKWSDYENTPQDILRALNENGFNVLKPSK